MDSIRLRKGRERWVAPLVAVGFLAAWETLSRGGVLSRVVFPPPTTIAAALRRLMVEGELLPNLGATLARLSAGFILGATPALLLGLAMGRSRRLRAAADPLIAAAHPIPKVAILPLLMILVGLNETSKVLLIALGAFFPVLISTMAGVREISPIHFEVAENYGAGHFKLFARVLLPGALPMVLAGARLGVNIALLLTITVEMFWLGHGLGSMIWMAGQTFRTEQTYAVLAVIAALGIIFNAALQWISRRLAPWQAEREV
jgi:NitT/TauT family transport system permease protein